MWFKDSPWSLNELALGQVWGAELPSKNTEKSECGYHGWRGQSIADQAVVIAGIFEVPTWTNYTFLSHSQIV